MPVAENFYQTLIDTALGYLSLGWSVIPLRGTADPDGPKLAAVAWEPYQHRRAREDEIAAWAAAKRFGALGIVCGSISQLAVLDFDESTLWQAFERTCPDLVATRTVLTRRGRHLYFHLPPQLVVRSRKLNGVDLLAAGCYIVAPPSTIDGFTYQIGRGGRPRSLSSDDMSRLNAFLDEQARKGPQKPQGDVFDFRGTTPHATPVAPQAGRAAANADSLHDSTSPEHLTLLYRAISNRQGRNVALFHTACIARDTGWSLAATAEVFAELHVAQPPVQPHRPERPDSRYREALATIRSVYSHPPRRPKPAAGSLFNSIREWLFQHGLTCVVRVYEGLCHAGYKAGQLVTQQEAFTALQGIVGRRSIRAALHAFTPTGRAIFKNIPPRNLSHCSAARASRSQDSKMRRVSRKKRVETPGRPSSTFRLPTLDRLCQLLGVTPSGSDPLSLDDLRTAKGTRLAAHRELIRRRPGLYLRRWLGQRLGICGVTISAYNRALDGLHVTPTFTATSIGWWNLNSVPSEREDTVGTCLEDDTGKRWPALKALAAKLLHQGKTLRLLAQTVSHYAFDVAPPNRLEAAALHVERVKSSLAQGIERFVRTLHPQAAQEPTPPVPVAASAPERERPMVAPPAPRRRRPNYHRPLTDANAEALALRVYQEINGRTLDAAERVSQATVRQWVDQIGERIVRQVLDRFRLRQGIVKPAGWFATLLRSERRANGVSSLSVGGR